MIAFLLAASAGGLINALIYLIIIGLALWVIWWLIGYIGLPEPFNKVVRVIVALIAVIIVVDILLGLAGHSFIDF